MSKIKWCIIGAGGIADRRMIPAILMHDDSEIVAVMDKNAEIAEKIRVKYGFEKAYSDEELMFKEVKCDAVYIATPLFCHYDQALLALKYGVNVLMEKPIAMNATQGKELLKAFKQAKKQFSIDYMMNYHNLHMKLKSFVKNDKLGQINSVRLQFTCWDPEIPGAWRQKKALGGGGAFMDLAVHCIDLAENILNDRIVDYKAFMTTNTFAYEVEDSAVMIFKTKKGTLGHIDVNFNIPDDCTSSKFEVYGTKGSAILEGTIAQEEIGKMKYIYAPQVDYVAAQSRTTAKAKTYKAKGGNIYLKKIDAFVKCLKNNKLDYKSAESAVRVAEICDNLYKEDTL